MIYSSRSSTFKQVLPIIIISDNGKYSKMSFILFKHAIEMTLHQVIYLSLAHSTQFFLY